MPLEVRYVKRATARVRAPRAKAKVARRRLLFFRGEASATEAVLDISTSGMKVLARGTPLAKGDPLSVEIVHPSLDGTLVLVGVVRWVRPEPGEDARYSAGVEFVDVPAPVRTRLEHVLALELGSMISIGSRGHVGFIARGAEALGMGDLLHVYDLDRTEIATIRDDKMYLNATRMKDGDVLHKQAASLSSLLRWVFEATERKVTIEPPIDLGESSG